MQLLFLRLGAPDFHPQTPNCPEETLTREYLQSGYRDTVEGLEVCRKVLVWEAQILRSKCFFKSLRKLIKKQLFLQKLRKDALNFTFVFIPNQIF